MKSKESSIFELQTINGSDLLLMRINYKLTTIQITKNEKNSKTISIKIFKSICYELRSLGKTIYSILNLKLTRSLSTLQIHKEKKAAKKGNLKNVRQKCRSH